MGLWGILPRRCVCGFVVDLRVIVKVLGCFGLRI